MQATNVISRVTRSTMFVLALVAILGFASTYWAWGSTSETIDEYLRDSTAQKTEILEKFLDERLIAYESILRGGAGLYDANSGSVTKEQWRLFANALSLHEEFPAIESLGYIESFSADQLEAHVARVRAQGNPEYSVRSDSSTETYSVAVYTEPETQTSPIGYNMLSEPIRAKTIIHAFETGEISLSQVLTLIGKPGKAILIVYPLYSQPNTPIELKKKNADHYVYLVVNIDKLFELGQKKVSLQNIEFAVSEADKPTNQEYIYQTDKFQYNENEAIQTSVNVQNKKWIIHYFPDKTSENYKNARAQPLIVAILGIIGTIAFTIFLSVTLKSRLQHVGRLKESELQVSRDELLSLASHQLRTPATSVKHYVGMLLEGYAGKVDKKQRELLTRAYSANERQLEIVSQILHVSRIESGRLELTGELVDIRKVVRNIVHEYKKTIKKKDQNIKVNIGKGIPLLRGDNSYLIIVIDNLLDNASKYTPTKGSISVQVYSDNLDVIIEVSDTGVGIDNADLEQLFKKFSRIHNDLSISAGGSGIGLYLSKLIVELHGGSIEAISLKNIGTTFRVKLPVIKK